MSVRLMSAIFENRELNPTARLIMLALADHADDDGRCYPSIPRLCQRTGLSERAIQTNTRALVEQGYVRIVPGGGKGNANLYFVSANPASSAPFDAPNPAGDAPRTKCTPAGDAPQTPQEMRANPAGDAPEPSGTIIEPSDKAPEGVRDILREVASEGAVTSFIAFRRKTKGKALTVTAAKRITANLRAIVARGGDADDALGLAEERGWLTVEPDWYFRNKPADKPRPADDRMAKWQKLAAS